MHRRGQLCSAWPLQELLEAGAQAVCFNNRNLSPLHFAAHRQHTQVVQLLADHGAAASLNSFNKAPRSTLPLGWDHSECAFV